MKRIICLVGTLLMFGCVNGYSQPNVARYKAEIFEFMNQILHDTTRLSYSEFVEDSIKLVKEVEKNDRLKDLLLNYRYDTFDTCRGPIRIREERVAHCMNRELLRNTGYFAGRSHEAEDGEDPIITEVYLNTAQYYKADPSFFENFKWPSDFHGLKTISNTEALEKQFKYKLINYFGMPLFNADFNAAIFSRGGNNWGMKSLYQKVDNRWRLIRMISMHII